MITLTHYLVLAALLFGISAMGIFMNRKNVLVLLMSIELMLLAVDFKFFALSPQKTFRGPFFIYLNQKGRNRSFFLLHLRSNFNHRSRLRGYFHLPRPSL